MKFMLMELFKAYGGQPEHEIEFKTPEEAGYKTVKELARGGQGCVWQACSETHGDVALHLYDKEDPCALSIQELLEEKDLYQRMTKNPYIQKSFEIFQDADYLYSVNELFRGGNLANFRYNLTRNNLPLTEALWKRVFKQCLLGVDFMHRHAVMHCDLKEENIFAHQPSVSAFRRSRCPSWTRPRRRWRTVRARG